MPTYLAVRRVRGPAWDRALPMRSQAGWAEHAVFMNALAAEGFVVLGGPLGSGEEVLLVRGQVRGLAQCQPRCLAGREALHGGIGHRGSRWHRAGPWG